MTKVMTILDRNLESQPVDDQANALVGERIRISLLETTSTMAADNAGRQALLVVEVSKPANMSTAKLHGSNLTVEAVERATCRAHYKWKDVPTSDSTSRYL